jgi:hypothetical protein
VGRYLPGFVSIKLEKALTLVKGGRSVTDAAKLSDLVRSTVYKSKSLRDRTKLQGAKGPKSRP